MFGHSKHYVFGYLYGVFDMLYFTLVIYYKSYNSTKLNLVTLKPRFRVLVVLTKYIGFGFCGCRYSTNVKTLNTFLEWPLLYV